MAEARFYVTREGKVVGDGALDAAQLIYVEGQEVDDGRLAEFGEDVPKQLKAMLKKATEKPEEAEKAEEPETKEVEHAEVEDKAHDGPTRGRRT